MGEVPRANGGPAWGSPGGPPAEEKEGRLGGGSGIARGTAR